MDLKDFLDCSVWLLILCLGKGINIVVSQSVMRKSTEIKLELVEAFVVANAAVSFCVDCSR